MQMKPKSLFELSPAELAMAPWWLKCVLKTGKMSFLALVGTAIFGGMALFGYGSASPWPKAALIVCMAWLGLTFLTMHIGFLAHAIKHRHVGYVPRMLGCGPLFWAEYFETVMKPRLSLARSGKKHQPPGRAKPKKRGIAESASNPPAPALSRDGMVCDRCGFSEFDYEDFWKEHSCRKCGWVRKA
jgi:hypothetical protein